jgi:8-oxo-dGTP pyrophosphatase MutT (NUDIX family)
VTPEILQLKARAVREAFCLTLRKELLGYGGVQSWRAQDRRPTVLNGLVLSADTPIYSLLINDTLTEPDTPVRAAGILVLEPANQVWVTSPTHQFGGYRNTFPKGTLQAGETAQHAAIRETWEETGLVAAIDALLGDFHRHRGEAEADVRYYLGHRVAGAPWAMQTAETERVSLVPLDGPTLDQMLLDLDGQATPDHAVLAALRAYKPYSIHDLRLDATPEERWQKSVQLIAQSYAPDVQADFEAASAYSKFIQWGKAVSDASHSYIIGGQEQLAEWQQGARWLNREYHFDYEPKETRLDAEPFANNPEVSARAAVRLVEHIRLAPERDVDVWRGLHAQDPIPALEKLAPGETLEVDRLASFSGDRTLALQFAERAPSLNHEYLFRLVGKAKGVALDALADRDQKEFVTDGVFQVEKVEREAATWRRRSGLTIPVERVTITLRQQKVY